MRYTCGNTAQKYICYTNRAIFADKDSYSYLICEEKISLYLFNKFNNTNSYLDDMFAYNLRIPITRIYPNSLLPIILENTL